MAAGSAGVNSMRPQTLTGAATTAQSAAKTSPSAAQTRTPSSSCEIAVTGVDSRTSTRPSASIASMIALVPPCGRKRFVSYQPSMFQSQSASQRRTCMIPASSERSARDLVEQTAEQAALLGGEVELVEPVRHRPRVERPQVVHPRATGRADAAGAPRCSPA